MSKKVDKKTSQLSNPFSTGGGGVIFETHIQAAFAILMLTNGFAPCLPPWPIKKIKLQEKYAGFDTDDLIVVVKHPDSDKKARLLAQIKHSICITKKDQTFGEVIQSAWNDFQNPSIFTVGIDSIALITGPLSATDTKDVRRILEWARESEDAKDFLIKVNLMNISSRTKIAKLKAFQAHIRNANAGIDVTDEQLWEFMKSFHLIGFDLDIKAGISLSLLHSLIGQYSPENSNFLWSKVVDEVQTANKNAGTISFETLSEDIRSTFQRRAEETIPDSFIKKQEIIKTFSWSDVRYASELAIAVLLGAWDEKNDEDKIAEEKLTNEDFTIWIRKIREILQQSESPLILKNGIWSITKRLEMWNALGPRLFNEHLDRLKEVAASVLKERNPMFDLPPDERYAASIHGKVLAHSHAIRKGLTESLALLGCHPKALTNCSFNRAKVTASLAVREIFADADWVLWASLNDLLPLLAEAAPKEFLEVIEVALQSNPCPFVELFVQEGNGINSGNYITGLLWALETLAWDKQYLIPVTIILGELAAIDPGGNWANRPDNSLTTIFLPWLPQTIAPVNKRKVALQTLQNELPEIAWKILLTLFPNQHKTSSGSHKPVWRRTIPEDWPKGITQKEYWEQITNYTDMAVEMAWQDIHKLSELIKHFDNLPLPALNNILGYLKSDDITNMPEKDRFPLWISLVDFVSKHKRYVDANWAIGPEIVEKINSIAELLAPQSPMRRYWRLFNRHDIDLYEENENIKEQSKKLEQHRQEAIREIIINNGFGAVIKFAESVKSSRHVGLTLGFITEENVDSTILPGLLETENNKLVQFVSGYILGKQHTHGRKWVDEINISSWTTEQTCQFLVHLPFTSETWKRTQQLLGKNESLYWKKVSVVPYQTESDLSFAIDRLISHGRPNAAISCLSRMLYDKQSMNNTSAVKALLAAVTSTEPANSKDLYDIVEIIKALQDDPNTNPDDLFLVEWAYLSLLDHTGYTSPKLLEQRLAVEPGFFCEVIRVIYRSKNVEKPFTEPSEQQKNIAWNAYQLLRAWKTPPGTLPDGSFSSKTLSEWLINVKLACKKSGHLDAALSTIGNVFIHMPPDPDGLWIHHTAANALNARDAKKIRDGFRIGIFNSRGIHWVDPTGKPEEEFAAKYRQRAEEVEIHGYHRLAATLRDLAYSYEREAEQIIEGHKIRGANKE